MRFGLGDGSYGQRGAPLTEAQQVQAVNAAIHQAMTSVEATDDLIHIVYAAVVSMSADDGLALDSRKYLHFGSSVSRLDQMKVKQIVPSPELDVAAPQMQNDTYLADYVEELIEALNDEEYVVTGSIKYEDDFYFDGDTIYVVNQSGDLLFGELTPQARMKLLVNNMHNSLLNSIWWTERAIPTPGSTIPLVNPLPDVTEIVLNIQAPHYTGISEVTAHYGDKQTKVYIFPINLLLDLNPAVLQSNTPQTAQVVIKNNMQAFTERPGLRTTVTLAFEEGGPIFVTSLQPGDIPIVNWTRDEQCGYGNVEVNLFAGTRYITGVRETVRVKCPFSLIKLTAASKQADNLLSSNFVRKTTLEEGDTLYVVEPGIDHTGERDIRLELEHSGSRGGFWTYIDNPGNDEPVISINSPNDLDNFTLDPPNGNEVAIARFNAPYPSTLPPYEKNTHKITASAFGEDKSVWVAFLSEERTEQTLNIPAFDDFINNKMRDGLKKLSDKINALLGTNITVEGAGLTGTRTTFNKEQEDRPRYLNNIEKSLAVGLGINTGNLFIEAPPYSGRLPFNAGNYGLYLNFGIGLQGAGEIASSKLHNETDYTMNTFTLEADLVGSGEFGIKLEFNEELDDYIHVNLGANITVPQEAKIKNEFRSDERAWYLVGELSFGPIYLVIPVIVRVLPAYSDLEWDLINMTFQWSLTNKMTTSHEVQIMNFSN